MDDIETQHLRCDHLDRVWLATSTGGLQIGYVDDDPQWPARLGPEPKWFLTEVNELLDTWQDAQGNDTRTAGADAYRSALGGLGR